MTASPTDDQAERRIQELTRALSEAQEQHAATAEILRIISRSPIGLESVLDTLVRTAAKFCRADDVVILRLDHDAFRAVAHHGPVRAPIGYAVPTGRGTVAGRSVMERRPIHVADLQGETEEFPEGSASAQELGYHMIVIAPLLREHDALGTILLRRTEVTPFSEKADRTAEDLRRSGGHRLREHTAVRSRTGKQTRAAGVARLPDCHWRGVGSNLPFAEPVATCARYHCADRATALPIRSSTILQVGKRQVSPSCPERNQP